MFPDVNREHPLDAACPGCGCAMWLHTERGCLTVRSVPRSRKRVRRPAAQTADRPDINPTSKGNKADVRNQQ